MELLNPKDYYKLVEPLQKVELNNLFARSVIENRIAGKVYVYDKINPKTFYVLHPYGMSLLFGDSGNENFNNLLLQYALNRNQSRNKSEWMQAFPASWDIVLTELFKEYVIKSNDNHSKKETGIIELNTRLNFTFNKQRYLSSEKTIDIPGTEIVQTGQKQYREIKGTVIPSYFWKDENDFLENGIGYSLLYKGELAATAYAAFIINNKLEIGIETVDTYRGKGFAEKVCSALVDYCLPKNYEPVWACRLENTGSYKLAQKLGFEVSKEIPFYRLSR
jgi:GNAT superfamily N-acetyltransferase